MMKKKSFRGDKSFRGEKSSRSRYIEFKLCLWSIKSAESFITVYYYNGTELQKQVENVSVVLLILNVTTFIPEKNSLKKKYISFLSNN